MKVVMLLRYVGWNHCHCDCFVLKILNFILQKYFSKNIIVNYENITLLCTVKNHCLVIITYLILLNVLINSTGPYDSRWHIQWDNTRRVV